MTEQEKLDIIFELLDDFTSEGKLYYHEENGSIWMINPETKQWIFEFQKSGDLWYSYQVFTDIFKYVSMEYPGFNPYITKWVERVLQNEIKNTRPAAPMIPRPVERVLQNEIKNTLRTKPEKTAEVERVLQNEVKNTLPHNQYSVWWVERVLQNEVKNINPEVDEMEDEVERVLQNEVKNDCQVS